MQARVLIVDDDQEILTALKKRLTWMGHEVLTANNGELALKIEMEDHPDLMLLDVEMPNLGGFEVLKRLSERRVPSQATKIPEVIVLTAYGTIDRAVEAMRLGAFDFLAKPFKPDRLTIVIDKAMEKVAQTRQIGLLQAEIEGRYEPVMGQSQAMVKLLETTRRAAGAPSTVLLLGETGTGKEVFARTLHRWSPRANKPFVVVNCAALPENLLENELFGHEKDAYTGASRREAGKIEAAEGGTVFLDEIGDMPAGLQTRLLRVLADQEFYRIGGTKAIRTNVRFVAATNKDLKEAINDGSFREDLFYRLNVISLELPPLHKRLDDVPALVQHFLQRHAARMGRRSISLTQDAMELIQEYRWPGNVRELENVLERAIVLCPDECIGPDYLGIGIQRTLPIKTDLLTESDLQYHSTVDLFSRKLIEEALRRSDGNQTRAAEMLGLQRSYLTRLIRQKGISMKPATQ